MLKTLLILLFNLFAIVGKSQRTDSSDYSIYSTIIKTNIPENKNSVVIFNMTSRDEYYNPWYGDTSNKVQLISGWIRVFQTPFDSSSYVLYRAFDSKHLKTEKLRNSFQLPIDVFLIKKASFRKLFKNSVQTGWDKFYEHHPNSACVFELSDVHYSKDKTKAVVYYAVRRNGLNGGGNIVILEKINGHWKTILEASLWTN